MTAATTRSSARARPQTTGSSCEARELAGVERVEVEAGDGDDRVTVEDLYATGVWQVKADLGAADGDLDRVAVEDSDEGNQTSVSALGGGVSVLAGVWTTIAGAEPTDRLRVNGNGGDDIVSASTGAMTLTLDGGDGDNVILGGPGPDTLIGGPGFDDVKGGRGDDTASMGAYFDRFSWAPGDGSDTVDGGPSRDSLSFLGSADAETLRAPGRPLHARRRQHRHGPRRHRGDRRRGRRGRRHLPCRRAAASASSTPASPRAAAPAIPTGSRSRAPRATTRSR